MTTRLNTEQAADALARLGYPVKPSTLNEWRSAGRGPAYLKVGNRVFYELGAIEGWLNTQGLARPPAPALPAESPDTILRRPEVERRTGLSRSGIYARISEGRFPAPVALGARAVGWRLSDLNAWLSGLQVKGGAQ
jgi:prophage regulatory protein